MAGDTAADQVFDFMMTRSPSARAIRYREEAARFQRMAQAETNARLRQDLSALAQQYTELADELPARIKPK